jgi:hypothetical protein
VFLTTRYTFDSVHGGSRKRQKKKKGGDDEPVRAAFVLLAFWPAYIECACSVSLTEAGLARHPRFGDIRSLPEGEPLDQFCSLLARSCLCAGDAVAQLLLGHYLMAFCSSLAQSKLKIMDWLGKDPNETNEVSLLS